MPNFTSGERRGTILLLVLITIIIAIMAMCRRNTVLNPIILQSATTESTSDTIIQPKVTAKPKHNKRKGRKSDSTKSARTNGLKRSHLDETLEPIE